jgi:hypothetical protein
MEKSRYRLLLDEVIRFGNPSVQEFSNAVVKVTRGDLTKLKCDFLPANSIYGNISEFLCGRNKLIYRKWIAIIYNENRHGCKVNSI